MRIRGKPNWVTRMRQLGLASLVLIIGLTLAPSTDRWSTWLGQWSELTLKLPGWKHTPAHTEGMALSTPSPIPNANLVSRIKGAWKVARFKPAWLQDLMSGRLTHGQAALDRRQALEMEEDPGALLSDVQESLAKNGTAQRYRAEFGTRFESLDRQRLQFQSKSFDQYEQFRGMQQQGMDRFVEVLRSASSERIQVETRSLRAAVEPVERGINDSVKKFPGRVWNFLTGWARGSDKNGVVESRQNTVASSWVGPLSLEWVTRSNRETRPTIWEQVTQERIRSLKVETKVQTAVAAETESRQTFSEWLELSTGFEPSVRNLRGRSWLRSKLLNLSVDFALQQQFGMTNVQALRLGSRDAGLVDYARLSVNRSLPLGFSSELTYGATTTRLDAALRRAIAPNLVATFMDSRGIDPGKAARPQSEQILRLDYSLSF